MAPGAGWTPPSAWELWMGFSEAEAGVGTPLGSGGSTLILAGGTGGSGGTVGTGETGCTGTAAAGTPRFAEPTGRRGREDRPPQTRAGTASWPACVLRGRKRRMWWVERGRGQEGRYSR